MKEEVLSNDRTVNIIMYKTENHNGYFVSLLICMVLPVVLFMRLK
jgi:hypothetical protein